MAARSLVVSQQQLHLHHPNPFSHRHNPIFSFNSLFPSPNSHRLLSTHAGFCTRFSLRCASVNGVAAASISVPSRTYEFCDGADEVELRLPLRSIDVPSSRDVLVNIEESSLSVNLRSSGSLVPLLEPVALYERIKPSETMWYIDDDELVVNLKKLDADLKWPDITETWESLTVGVMQLLKGTSIYVVGDSREINQKVAYQLAEGLRYTPLDTSELLESITQKTVDSWLMEEGPDSVADAERAVLESLSSHVRAVVATLGGPQGAAGRSGMWRHLHAGFTVWVSQSEATDEVSAKEEAQQNILEGRLGYTKADVVVKLSGWNPEYTQVVAQSCLSALKQLVLSDKKLPGKKSLYIRLGCRGDWPNIKPPGWDPSSGLDVSPGA